MSTEDILKRVEDDPILRLRVQAVAARENLTMGEAVIFCLKRVVLPNSGVWPSPV